MGNCVYCNKPMTHSELRYGYDEFSRPIHEECYITEVRIENVRKKIAIRDAKKTQTILKFEPMLERGYKEIGKCIPPVNLDARIANLQLRIAEKDNARVIKKEKVFPSFA